MEKEFQKQICKKCGHGRAGCECDWCHSVANEFKDLEEINFSEFLSDMSESEKKDWELTNKIADDWYPILCCEGGCDFE